MSSNKKTHDYAEIHAQFLANDIIWHLAKKDFFNRKISLERIDIHSFVDGLMGCIRFGGLAIFPYHPGVKVRFDGTFRRPLLNNGKDLSWGERDDLLNGPIKLRINGTDVEGTIDRVLFTRSNHNEHWAVANLQTPEVNGDLNQRISEALGI